MPLNNWGHYMATNSIEYKGARIDKTTNARWDWLAKKWLEVEETQEWTTLGEFARAYGVAMGQLSDKIKQYRKRLNKC